MSRPRDIVLSLRTPAQELEDRIKISAASIRRNWPHMLPVAPPAIRIGSGSRSSGILGDSSTPDRADAKGRPSWSSDHDNSLRSASDVDALTRVVSLRRYATDCLNSWCRVIVEDRDLTKAIPDGSDVPAMCAFIETHANWVGPQDFADDAADELEELAGAVAAIADPPKRERHTLGRCTFVIPGDLPDVHDRMCRGKVTMPIGGDTSEASCDQCDTAGPVRWWEEVLTLTPTWWVATGPELARILAQRATVSVDERTIRRWKSAGRISAIDAFGPQPYQPRYDVRTVLEQVACFDHECIMCGRPMGHASDLCLACLSTARTTKPTRRARVG